MKKKEVFQSRDSENRLPIRLEKVNDKCIDCGANLTVEDNYDQISCPNGCSYWDLR